MRIVEDAHDAQFEADRKWMFACFDAQAVSYDVLKRLLKKAGLPKPSTAGHAYRDRLVKALEGGLRGEALVAEMQRPFEASNTEMYWKELLNSEPTTLCRMAA